MIRAAAAVIAVLLGACTSSPPSATPATTQPAPTAAPTDLPTLPPCEYPEEVAFPEWIPKDLPLPEDTYGMDSLEPLAGYERALLVVPTTLDLVTTFVLERWPEEGWVLGTGDAEPGEIEDQFQKGKAVGAFKAQSVFCDPGFV
ncbi:MAG TPA: hypothetical protein VGB28_00415, partial [Actinomycetota bacterium]